MINAHPPSYPATFISALTLCSRNGLSQLASPKSTIVTNSLLYALYIVCIFWRHPIKKEWTKTDCKLYFLETSTNGRSVCIFIKIFYLLYTEMQVVECKDSNWKNTHQWTYSTTNFLLQAILSVLTININVNER